MPPSPPGRLKCEYLEEPLGVDTPMPRFSWILESPKRGEAQQSYQVLVATALELLRSEIGDYWDSGKVDSDRTCLVEYQGEELLSCTRYFWQVRWWDLDGSPSGWSDPATFVTGFLHEGDWKAHWISARYVQEFRSRGNVLLGEQGEESVQTHAMYLRREFEVREKAVMAVAFIAGLGHSELRLNGEKVGDRVLDPGWTDYAKRALYSTYDLTSLVREKNAVGIILGNGRHIKDFGYDPPRVACRIEVEYESGDREVILSDESWKSSGGPLLENGLYFGERYDARLEKSGWDRPGFDDAAWDKALPVAGTPLASQMMPPVRVVERLRARSMTSIRPGLTVYDFGQNFSGWVRLQARGPAGTEIRLRHAELLHEDGTLNTGPNENAAAADVYILRGEGLETFEPRFTYHGFRYVELSGYPGEPSIESLEGCFVHSDVERTGSFACSNELVNRIHRNIHWGQLSNLMSIPTDCPQRDERHGWLADAHLSAEEALFNFDMGAFYSKFLEDIRLAQRDDGSLPDVVPPYLPRLYPADPAWGSAYAGILWLVWEHCGDARLIARHYPYLKKYVDFLGRSAEGHIIRGLGKYGDWCPPGSIVPKKTPVELTSTWSYYHDVTLLGRMAMALGRNDDAQRYARLAQDILAAFNAAFLGEDQYAAMRVSRIDNYPNQTSNVLPLYMGIVPADRREKVLASLLRSVVRLQDGHVDTGILGTRYILDVLAENGQAEAAFRMATREGYPGWAYMISEGATTLWERWERLTGFAMNSQNHIMLGSVDAWFYRVLAGLSPLAPGWKAVRVRPHLVGGLTFAEAAVRTVRGEVRSAWKRDEASMRLEVRIPVGAAAKVHVPLPWPKASLTESGRPLWENGIAARPLPDVTLSGAEGGWVVFETGSGDYAFEASQLA